MTRVQVVALILSLLVTGFIVEKVRRRSLAIEYSLIWIVAGLGMIVLSFWKQGIEHLARLMGIFYAPSALFVVFGVFGVVMCIHFSLAISKLSSGNRILVQQIALMEDELQALKEQAGGVSAADGAADEEENADVNSDTPGS